MIQKKEKLTDLQTAKAQTNQVWDGRGRKTVDKTFATGEGITKGPCIELAENA